MELAHEINKIEKSIIAANSGINRERSKSIFMITTQNSKNNLANTNTINNENGIIEQNIDNNEKNLYKNVLKKGTNSVHLMCKTEK